jgi:glycerophosphoryl diester phosphodiesterase
MENALSAFRKAVAEGYRYLETDAHATSDGVAVVHHDHVLDRTTDGSGAVAALRWSVVRDARIAGREPMCGLEHLLEELPEAFLNIDVKADSAVEPVLRTIRRARAWDRVCLASFSESRLTTLRRHGGEQLLTSLGPRSAGALWARARLRGLPVRTAVRGQLAQVPVRRGPLTVVDHRLVRVAHHWGLEVHVWTVDDARQMTSLLDLGVDGLVTDRPDMLRDVLRSRGAWRA